MGGDVEEEVDVVCFFVENIKACDAPDGLRHSSSGVPHDRVGGGGGSIPGWIAAARLSSPTTRARAKPTKREPPAARGQHVSIVSATADVTFLPLGPRVVTQRAFAPSMEVEVKRVCVSL